MATRATPASSSDDTRPARTPRPGRRQKADDKKAERLAKMRARSGHRYLIHYDIDGPRIRLGIGWFLLVVLALPAGRFGFALVFGGACAIAAAHGLRTWRARGAPVEPGLALAGVVAVVLAGLVGPPAMGLVLIAFTAIVVLLAFSQSENDARRALASVGLVLQTALPPALAGGCIVLLADLEVWAVIALFLLVSAYETGDYIIGSGSSNSVEGPVAGAAAVLVVAAAIAALGFPPFDIGQAMAFGLSVAPMAVAGQYLASAMLPHSRAWAPALRRVDSLLLAAPAWYVGIDLLVI